jgi:hypothetical protein
MKTRINDFNDELPHSLLVKTKSLSVSLFHDNHSSSVIIIAIRLLIIHHLSSSLIVIIHSCHHRTGDGEPLALAPNQTTRRKRLRQCGRLDFFDHGLPVAGPGEGASPHQHHLRCERVDESGHRNPEPAPGRRDHEQFVGSAAAAADDVETR